MPDAESRTPVEAGRAEIHVFILWSAALAFADAIYDDLEREFELVDSILVRWNQETFDSNLMRMYGAALPDRSAKMATAGVEPFHVLVVRDREPVYATRWRSWGLGPANVRTYDAKARYREWTGGAFRVHATLDRREAERDTFMLTGRRIDEYAYAPAVPWERTPRREYDADVTGAHGWASLAQLFAALAVCVRFVVLWRGEAITLLVDDRERAAALAAGRDVPPTEALVECRVAGEAVVLELREIGDGTLDRNWQRAMLRHRLRDVDGSFEPTPEDSAYVRLYELVAHMPPSERRGHELVAIPPEILPSGDYGDAIFARAVLEEFMLREGYDYAVPASGALWRNPAVLGRGPRFRRFLRGRAPGVARLGGRMVQLIGRG
jgi:hypothetical protein